MHSMCVCMSGFNHKKLKSHKIKYVWGEINPARTGKSQRRTAPAGRVLPGALPPCPDPGPVLPAGPGPVAPRTKELHGHKLAVSRAQPLNSGSGTRRSIFRDTISHVSFVTDLAVKSDRNNPSFWPVPPSTCLRGLPKEDFPPQLSDDLVWWKAAQNSKLQLQLKGKKKLQRTTGMHKASKHLNLERGYTASVLPSSHNSH